MNTIPPALALVGRTHLLLLHFPIALIYGVVVIELLFRRAIPADKRSDVTAALLLVTAFFALVTTGTGLLFGASEDFHGHTQVLLAQHRTGGIVTAVFALAAFVTHRRSELKKGFWPMLVGATVAVTFTGHRGGELVHGEGYVLEALDKDKKDDKKGDDEVVAPSDGDDEKEERQRQPEGKVVEKPDYVKDIKPLLNRSCVKCHGPEKRKSGLRLDKKRFAMKGGETGPAIVPGDVEKSLLTKYIQLPSDDDDVMPSKGKLLAQSEIETLKNWVAQGATWPDE